MPEKPLKSPFYAQGLRFSCRRCSRCCRFESGYVFLSEKDASCIAIAMNMKYKEFIEAFCRWIPSENGIEHLSLKEKSNLDCIFWAINSTSGKNLILNQEGCCSIYAARPFQCKAFPFWPSVLQSKEHWKAAADECPGIGKGKIHSHDSIKEWLTLRAKEPIISRKAW